MNGKFIEDFFIFHGLAIQDEKVRGLCKYPYPKHPHGCPNFGKKPGCPPNTPLFDRVYSKEVYIAVARLDLAFYVSFMRDMHPGWTERALRNPRHWQGHLRSQLKSQVLDGASQALNYVIVTNPEAMGINVFETCAKSGFLLERHPKQFVCQVALLCKPL